MNCGAIQFIDFVMVDNEVAGMDLKLVIGTSWGEEKGALVKNALIVGHSSVEDEESETGVAMVTFTFLHCFVFCSSNAFF